MLVTQARYVAPDISGLSKSRVKIGKNNCEIRNWNWEKLYSSNTCRMPFETSLWENECQVSKIFAPNIQCRLRGQPKHNTRPHASLPHSFLGMDHLTTDCNVVLKSTLVIYDGASVNGRKIQFFFLLFLEKRWRKKIKKNFLLFLRKKRRKKM